MKKNYSNWHLLVITFIERFAFYLFTGSLILYLMSKDNFAQEKSFKIYSIFKVLIYSLPIVMGIVSDIIDRQKLFKIGLLISVVGYVLIPILHFNYWLLIFSIIVLSIGIAIIKPNIPVLIGNNISNAGNNKRLLKNFTLMSFFVILAPMIVNEINYSFSDKTFLTVIISNSLLMLIAFLLFYFIPTNNYKPKIEIKFNPIKSGLFIAAIFIIAYIVMILTDMISTNLAIETESSKLSFQDITNVLSIPLTIIFLIVLAIKSIKIRLNNILLLFGLLTIGFALIFLSVNFQEISRFSFSPDKKMLVIALIAGIDTIFFPIITLLIFKFSIRYKGFIFGLYYSLTAFISYIISDIKLNRFYLLIPITILIMSGIIMIFKRDKIKTSVPNKELSLKTSKNQ